ncbi:MAG: FecR domain-containing protein [Bacteroidota bacterium]
MNAEKDTLYARWLAGDLSAEEQRSLQASGELEDLKRIVRAADKLAIPKYDAEVGFDRFKANRAVTKTAKVRRLRTKSIWPMLAVAASVLLLITAGIFLFRSPSTIEIGNGMTLTHQFQDNSSVVLNDGSNIVYDKKNWDKERSLKLTGEAFFDVQKGQPFIVQTDVGQIEVLGTSFNVRAWGDRLYVECYTGKVQVTHEAQTAILEKGESVRGVLGELKAKQVIRHEQPFWSTGSSRFYEAPLLSVFEELERQYDVTVTVPKIQRLFSGDFQHDNLANALNAICKPMGLQFELSEDAKRVTISEI